MDSTKDMTLQERLLRVQTELKAPKNQFNKFGGYKYRSQEDILEAVKPLLLKYGLTMFIRDHVSEVAGMPYVESAVIVTYNEKSIEVRACAGIDVNTKGMSWAQAFGSSSSYARKYALNGMYLIDDTKDDDYSNNHGKESTSPKKKPIKEGDKFWINGIEKGATLEQMSSYYQFTPELEEKYLDALTDKQ